MSRSPELQKFVDGLLESNGKPSMEQSRKAKVCSWCQKPIDGFRDALSYKEYRISGMCQVCQDAVFNEGEE